jgi:hypothetical protein
VTDKGLDILNPVPHSNAPRAVSEGYDILAMIDGYENEGRDILKAGGYPLTVDEIIHDRFDEDGLPLGKKPLPRRVRDVMDMLLYFDMVRVNIEKKDISFALCFMAYGVQAAMKARIRPQERSIDIGAARRIKQIEIRSKRDTWHGQTRVQLSERNQKILEHFKRTHLTPASFAEDKKNQTKYDLKPRTIRLILSKAVGNLPG